MLLCRDYDSLRSILLSLFHPESQILAPSTPGAIIGGRESFVMEETLAQDLYTKSVFPLNTVGSICLSSISVKYTI